MMSGAENPVSPPSSPAPGDAGPPPVEPCHDCGRPLVDCECALEPDMRYPGEEEV